MTLRYYQQAGHDAVIDFIKKSTLPCLIEAETGSGKSHMIAAIAQTFYEMSGKHVLCTAPNVDLVRQNTEKFMATGNKASIFSASIGKSLKHPVVFGTPLTVLNQIHKFDEHFGMIIIDECHGITPTIQSIIEKIKGKNNNLRVVGLSATPYRLNTGLIYAIDEHGEPSPESECTDPYFTKKVYTIGGRELIDGGFLTRPIIGAIHSEHYDTLNMRINSMGKFYQEDIDRAYTGQDRKTAGIIADIVNQSRYRQGVMIFAATVQHAKECMSSLPKEISRMIGGDINMNKDQRKKLVADFKKQEFKYLVSVGTMTTGVDFTHVDVIAMMRATESIALLKQCIGRGLRIHPDKDDVLVLDYAENIERHCGEDADIFSPKIKAYKAKSAGKGIKAKCEQCGVVNEFSARKNDDGFGVDENGYFTDLDGNRIESEFGAFPAHYGRRCLGLDIKGKAANRCEYRWTSKKCPHCEAENDIAARYCSECKGELVNPNDKLIADYRARKADPYSMQCDKVLSWHPRQTLSAAGNECLAVDFTTTGRSFTVWFQVRSGKAFLIKEYDKFMNATQGGEVMPETVTYKREKDSVFYRIHAYNQEEDRQPCV